MEQQWNNQEEANGLSTVGKVKDSVKDKVQRPKSKLDLNSEADDNHSQYGDSHSSVYPSNFEDFPYDGTGEDAFTLELASAADEQRDEIGSPMSQDSSQNSFSFSPASGLSWTSTQKTIAGLGIFEVGSVEVLGPYKRVGAAQALEAVPTEYKGYGVNRNRDEADSQMGFTSEYQCRGYGCNRNMDEADSSNTACARSPSQTSDTQNTHLSLYNYLSSISDRDLQVPEGIIKPDGFDCEFDKELSPTPSQSCGMVNGISKMNLNDSAQKPE